MKKCLLAAATFLALSCVAHGQTVGNISTVAGGGIGDGGPAVDATLAGPRGVALLPGGALLVADTGHGRVRRIAPDGTITTVFVGSRKPAGWTGRASCPTDIVADAAGVAYFSDPCGHLVYKISASGTVSAYAGNGVSGLGPDGVSATQSSLTEPAHLALDGANNLYISQPAHNLVRKVDASGTITNFAGGGYDAPTPRAMAVDASGSLYVFAWGLIAGSPGAFKSSVIVKYSASLREIVAGTGAVSNSGDGGAATSAGLGYVNSLAFDGAGNLLLGMADRVRRITPAGVIDSITTTPASDLVPSGADLVVASGDQVHRVVLPANATLLAGHGDSAPVNIGDGGSALSARLGSPVAVAVDGPGNVYIADAQHHRVRRVDVSGAIGTLAGTGAAGYSGDGAAANAALLSNPSGIAVDAVGNVFIADRGNHRVRRIDASGIITTAAGTGTSGYSGDGGLATAAQLSMPSAVAIDPAGNLLIADQDNERIRRVTPAGTISTVAGGGSGRWTFGAAPMAATAQYLLPTSVSAAGGEILVAEFGDQAYNSYLQRVAADGTMSLVVATYEPIQNWASQSSVPPYLAGVADGVFGPAGLIYVSDPRGARVLEWKQFVGLKPVAGRASCTGTCGEERLGDGGPAVDAVLGTPRGLAWHAGSGSLFIADDGQRRVRKVAAADPMPAPFSIAEVTGAALSALVTSESVTPSGFTHATSISVVGGEYSIGCTGTFTAAAGSISPGEAVCVQVLSAGSYNTRREAVLTVGGRMVEFIATTLLGPGSASLSASSIDFPEQLINTPTAAATITVTNTGANEIMLGSWVSSPGIDVTRQCSPIISAGGSCQLTLTLKPPAEGAYSGTVTLRLSIGFVSIAVTGSGSRSLASHFYRSILDREPEASGRAFWDAEAARADAMGADPNEAWYAMAATFFSSPEYRAFNRSDDEFLSNLYRNFFDREPDAGGVSYWKAQIAAGLPRDSLVTAFTFSTEFRAFTTNVFGTVQVRPEVNLVMDLYRGYFSRLPDDAGFAYWVGRLRAIQCGPVAGRFDLVRAEVESMTRGFLASAEYVARARTDAQFLSDMYAALFRRGADVAGLGYWKERMASGESRDAVRAAMIGMTQEFLVRAMLVAGGSCIK